MTDMPFTLRFTKLLPTASTPTKATPHSSVYELRAVGEHIEYTVVPGDLVPTNVPTGLAFDLPHCVVGLLFPVPRCGVLIPCGRNIIDSSTRSELYIPLISNGVALATYRPGDIVAHVLFVRHEVADLIETNHIAGG
ncbi:MAG: deoxyuridine 5'-triphosphate nucleotidohydrolase [Firmicutes bacterium ADurb.Bin506]|nr:MAG: deoxyuridine 5'-triphosphate nucleotidohydrolase [Firmicutes bacterium ADurb.Bin506]